MFLKFNSIYNLYKKIKRKIDKKLIVFLVRNNLITLLSILFVVKLKKIKHIAPSNKIKYTIIVLPKSGGIDDLISSQKKYNKNILYLSIPREFFVLIYYGIFQINHQIETKYLSKNQIKFLREKYLNFLIKFVKKIREIYKFEAFIGFNFDYLAEVDLHKACSALNISFLLIYKESVATEIENKYRRHILKKKNERFYGYKIATYSLYAKKNLTDTNFISKNRVEVVGCPRLSDSFSFRNMAPKNQILYYVIENTRGLPSYYVKIFGNKFFEDLKDHKKFNPKYNWNTLHNKTVNVLKKFAINNPDISIIFKIKTGQPTNSRQYLNLPKNIKVNYFGVGHNLIKQSKVIIAWNTTALLESLASNRFILLPYFHKKNNFQNLDEELILKLKKQNYAYSETEFYKKLEFLINKNYNKKQLYNNLFSLKYHLGNDDNKAGLRLDKFIRKNIFINTKTRNLYLGGKVLKNAKS